MMMAWVSKNHHHHSYHYVIYTIAALIWIILKTRSLVVDVSVHTGILVIIHVIVQCPSSTCTNRGRIRTFLEKGNLVTGLVVCSGELHRHAVHLLTLLHLVCVVILNKSVKQDIVVDCQKRVWGMSEAFVLHNFELFPPPLLHHRRRGRLCTRLQEYRGGICKWRKSWTDWESWYCEQIEKVEIVKVCF